MTPSLPLRRRIASLLTVAGDRMVAPASIVALHSQPDLDDNVVALLRTRPPGLPVAVLVDDVAAARARARALDLDVPLVARRSPRGGSILLRARVLVTTHGLLGSPRRRGRKVLGLWHGEFGKRVGHLAGEPPRHFDWMPVSSELSQTQRAAEFRLPPGQIAVVGSPRQSLLAAASATASDTSRAVVWAPTYRRSAASRRNDGDPTEVGSTLRPDDPDLQALLRKERAELWYRPHPAEWGAPSPPGVRLARDCDLERQGLTFYELLSRAECLITDYSSLWIDFLLRDRPMISFCPDLHRYRATRGLALEPHEHWFPGPVVTSKDELLAGLEAALRSTGDHAASREFVRRLLHTSETDNPGRAVWDRVENWMGGRR